MLAPPETAFASKLALLLTIAVLWKDGVSFPLTSSLRSPAANTIKREPCSRSTHLFMNSPDASRGTGFSLDPTSELSEELVKDKLKLSTRQYETLIELSHSISSWNQNINLISRKDDSPAVVFGRHILPSLAVAASPTLRGMFTSQSRVVDVGTGGGFPGLPLAVAFPETSFVLLDSVGKKLNVVQEIANELGLENVATHHGRSEDFRESNFDVVTGRSVTAIPQFLSWTHHLLQPNGRVLYWIGGDIDEPILDLASSAQRVSDLLGIQSDKRVLEFNHTAVTRISAGSGIVAKPTRPPSRQHKQSRNKAAKGSWTKRSASNTSEQTGDSFSRYNSEAS